MKKIAVHDSIKKVLNDNIIKMLSKRMIRTSNRDVHLPMVIYKKNNRENWVCIDFQQISKFVKAKNYRLHLVQNILQEVFGLGLSYKIELKSAYNPIMVKPRKE
jgi:hypothetical protein